MNSNRKKPFIVLGIETSCDDTSLAILQGLEGVSGPPPKVLSHQSFSQIDILKKWGGVVPEIAARNHTLKLTPLMALCIKEAKIPPHKIDIIAVTTHPGLLGPLLTGLNHAKSLALFFNKPILPVNHLYAHLEAIHLTEQVPYPYLGLLVSGGHTFFTLVTSPTGFKILGGTLDDAAGEAFDKGGKLMGLGYPAGKIIDELAKEGDKHKYKFPIGLEHSKDVRMSFSGVKTSMRLFTEKNSQLIELKKTAGEFSQDFKDLCASYQHSIIMALKVKAHFAFQKASEYGLHNLPLVIGGGVACNSYLRKTFQKHFPQVFCVAPEYCADNGAMVANRAFRTTEQGISFPECLTLDARGKFIKKSDGVKKNARP